MLEIFAHIALAFAPSPPAVHVDVDLIVAWTANEAKLSTDGGTTFEQIVDAPGEVRDVRFDVYGRVVVLVDSLPDHQTQILGDGPGGTYVVTTAFDSTDTP